MDTKTKLAVPLNSSSRKLTYHICGGVVILWCGICIAAVRVLAVVVARSGLLVCSPPSRSCRVVEWLIVGIIMLLIVTMCHGRCRRLTAVLRMCPEKHTHTHSRFTALLEFVRDYPGEQVPER